MISHFHMLQRNMQEQLGRSALNPRNFRLEQCFPNIFARGPFSDSKKAMDFHIPITYNSYRVSG